MSGLLIDINIGPGRIRKRKKPRKKRNTRKTTMMRTAVELRLAQL